MTTGNLRDHCREGTMIKHFTPGKLYRTETFFDAYENDRTAVKLSPGIVLMYVERCPCDAVVNQDRIKEEDFEDFKFLFGDARISLCTIRHDALYIKENLQGPL